MCCCEDDYVYQQRRYQQRQMYAGGGGAYVQMGDGRYGGAPQQMAMQRGMQQLHQQPLSPEEGRFQQMLSNLMNVSNMCQQAHQLYRQAMQWERQAARDNNAAQGMAFFDGGGMFEMMEQGQRDNDMQAAFNLANQGSMLLQQAFARVPQGCAERQSFPRLMSNIGLVPVPMLGGGNFNNAMMMDFFGGGFGAMANDWQSANEIQRNMMVIRQCEVICGQQQARLRTIIAKIEAQILQLRQQAASTQAATAAAAADGAAAAAPPPAAVPAAAAVPQQQKTFAIIVPQGVDAGQLVEVQAPNGQTVQVQVPEGLQAGQQFTVSY